MTAAIYHFAHSPAPTHASLLDSYDDLPSVIDSSRASAQRLAGRMLDKWAGWQGAAHSAQAVVLEIGVWLALVLSIAAA